MVGASHQIFHVLILAAAAAHYVSIRRAYAFWHTVEALGAEGGGERAFALRWLVECRVEFDGYERFRFDDDDEL